MHASGLNSLDCDPRKSLDWLKILVEFVRQAEFELSGGPIRFSNKFSNLLVNKRLFTLVCI